MFTKAAFGAISGAIVALLLDPLLKLLPAGDLVKQYISSFVLCLLTAALSLAGALLFQRIKRLDHFINAHIWWMAGTASVLFAASLWLNAGMPTAWPAIASAAFSGVVAFLFFAFSGRVITKAMHQYTADQAPQAQAEREREAQGIAWEAVTSGELEAGIGILTTNVAGESAEAWREGCLTPFLTLFLGIGILLAATFAAHFSYGLAWIWSILTAVIVLLGGMGILAIAESIGTAHADKIPWWEKFRSIFPGG